MSGKDIFVAWLFFQLGNALCILLDVRMETILANFVFSGGFMLALLIKSWLK